MIDLHVNAGPSEAGRLGRPEPPHFFVEKVVIIVNVHSLLSGATPHWYLAMNWGVRVAARVCTISIKISTTCFLRAAGLCEFSCTFVFLSDRDVFVSTASTGDWCQGAPALTFRGNNHINFLPIFANSAARPSDRLAATWLRLTKLEIDGFK